MFARPIVLGLQGGSVTSEYARRASNAEATAKGPVLLTGGSYWNPGNRTSSEKTAKARQRKSKREKEGGKIKNSTTCSGCQLFRVVYIEQSHERAVHPRQSGFRKNC